MKQRIKEMIALLLALSLVISAPGMHARAFEGDIQDEVFDEITVEAETEAEEADEPEADIVIESEEEASFTDSEEIQLQSADKSRLTLMIYGVGSDLERKNHFLSLDMTEILSGMDAALSLAEGTDAKNLPINVIVETGGITFQPTSGDNRSEAEKATERAKSWKAYDEKHSAFMTYDRDLKKIIGNDNIKSHAMFELLTMAEMPEEINSYADLNENIDWSKNQRWEIVPDISLLTGASLNPAKNPVNAGNENLCLTATDSSGVITELYDFVYTTMQQYPAEQYALIMWDHGGGPVAGFGVDERAGEVDASGNLKYPSVNPCINGTDIRNTMAKLKTDLGEAWQPFAFAGYDACLMADFDDVAAWQGYSRYLIASEDLEGGSGWYYLPWMKTLSVAAMDQTKDDFATADSMDALTETVGIEIVDTFNKWYEGDDGTLALFDLRGDAISELETAVEELSEAVVTCVQYDPIEAFRIFYNGNKLAIKFAGDGKTDLRSLCTYIKAQFSQDNYMGECEIALYEKADALEKLILDTEKNQGKLIRYYKNTGSYEVNKTLGGITLYTPHTDAPSDWNDWMDIYGKLEGRQSYKDMMGTYAAIQAAGKVLYDIYINPDEKYSTQEAGRNELERVLDESIKKFKVSDAAQELIEEAAEDLYDARITANDCLIIKRNNEYYSSNKHWDLVDDVYQHARLDFKDSEDKIQNLYLGYLSDGEDTDSGLRLDRYGKELEWYYLSDKEKSFTYPVNIVSAEGLDPLTGIIEAEIPAYLVYGDDLQEDGTYASFYYSEPVMLEVHFDENSTTGVVEAYRTVGANNVLTSRYVTKDEFTDDVFISPIYDYAEKLKGDAFNYLCPANSEGKYILKAAPIKTAVLGRGTIPKEALDSMAKDLESWSYAENKVLGTTSATIDAQYLIRSMFQMEYNMFYDADAVMPKKATVMIYGVGSDLERNSYELTFDMTEMIAGLTAAKNKLGLQEMPINVVADLGGVSYEPTEAEVSYNITREDKIGNREKARLYYKAEGEEFAEYDKKIKELGGGENVSSYNIFSSLTPTVKDGEVVSGDAISWDKNQRYELLPASAGDDGSLVTFALAKNAYEDGDARANTPMTEADENGVTTELYDFVKTSIENYPAEQYILIFWDHGGGATRGFGYDEREDDGTVTSYNIKKTFDKLSDDVEKWEPLSFVGYDACLMGNAETAKAWYGNAEYLLGSEANEGGSGWNHVGWTFRLCEAAAADDGAFSSSTTMEKVTEDVAKIAIDDYVAWYNGENKKASGTLALLKLERGSLKALEETVGGFADALLAYLKARPVEAYSDLYYIRKDSAAFADMVDLRYMAGMAKKYLSLKTDSTEAAVEQVNAVIAAADRLISFIDSKNPVVYQKNTGYFENGEAKGTSELGGLTMGFPSGTAYSDSWKKYIAMYKDLDPDCGSWRDLVGSYLAIKGTGDELLNIFKQKYTTKELAVAALNSSLANALTDYTVSESLATTLRSALPEQLYEQRITPNDTNVIQIFDDYYFTTDYVGDKELIDGVSQHGYLVIGDDTYGLGYLPGGFIKNPDDNNGIKLFNYGKENNWIWMKQADGNMIYPAPIYETYYVDMYGDTMSEELMISIPAVAFRLSKTADGKDQFDNPQNIYLYVYFDQRSQTAELAYYSKLEVSEPYPNSREFDVEELKGKYIMPLYNAFEYMREDVGGKPSYLKEDECQPILFEKMVISRGEEKDGLSVVLEANPKVKADDIYLSTQYYVNDKFEQAYELKKKEYKAFGIKWNGNDLQGTTRRLSEGSVIRREDILPVVSVSGAYSEEDTEKYANNILSLVKIEAGATTTYLTEEGFKVPGETSVTLFLDQNDICPEKLEPGYDKLTELEQMDVRNEWANEIYPVWDNVRIRADVVKNAINDDDPKSGMENTLPIFPISDNVFRVTMVKGQTYSFGAGKWTSDNAKIVSVGKANGKATAKKVTALATKEDEEDQVVTLTNSGVTPEVKYEVMVVEPKLYEVVDNAGNSQFFEAKTLNLTTLSTEDTPTTTTLEIASSVVKDDVPMSLGLSPSWTSSNPKVATVTPVAEDGSSSCKVTAVAKGSAKITGWVNGKAYSCTVSVTDVYNKKTSYGIPTQFGLDKDEDGVLRERYHVFVNPGVSLALNYNAKKTGFVPKKATWKYYNGDEVEIAATQAPAFVDSKGKLVAKQTGFVTLVGSYTDKGTTVNAEFGVWVVSAPTKRITYLAPGKKETIKFYKVTSKKGEWNSSNPEIASVDKAGKVTALKVGSTEISCTYNGSVYKTTVCVEDPALNTSDERLSAGAKANTYKLTLKKGTRFFIEAPGVYQTLNWKSSKAAVAFVDENGVVEARSAGKTSVTTKINGVTVKIDVVVE